MPDETDPLMFLASMQRLANIPTAASASRVKPLSRRQYPMSRLTANLPDVPREIASCGAKLQHLLVELINGKLPWPLVLRGQPGAGKTCAALCLLDYANGQYWKAAQWVKAAQDARFGRLTRRNSHTHVEEEIDEELLWEQLAKAPLAVLDELGTRDEVTGPHYEIVFQWLSVREFLPHVVISNLSFEDLDAAYDARITSRLLAGTVVVLDGKDRRWETKP